MDSILRIAPWITTPFSLAAVVALCLLLWGRSRHQLLRAALDHAGPADLPAVLDGGPAWMRDLVGRLGPTAAKEVALTEIQARAETTRTGIRVTGIAAVLLAATSCAAWAFAPAERREPDAPVWAIRSADAERAADGWSLAVAYDADGVRGGTLGLRATSGGTGPDGTIVARDLAVGPGRTVLVHLPATPFAAGAVHVALVVVDGPRVVHASPASRVELR